MIGSLHCRVVDQDFARPLIVSLIVGLLIVGTGTVLLFYVFRAVAEGRKSEARFLGLATALVVFLIICCAIFFAISLR